MNTFVTYTELWINHLITVLTLRQTYCALYDAVYMNTSKYKQIYSDKNQISCYLGKEISETQGKHYDKAGESFWEMTHMFIPSSHTFLRVSVTN